MESITLSPLGAVPVAMPASFLARLDLVQAFGSASDGPHAARVLAAAVGLCWADKSRPLPAYNPVESHGAVLAYGAAVIEALLGRYKVPAVEVFAAGRLLADFVAESLPSAPAVDAARDFSSPEAGS